VIKVIKSESDYMEALKNIELLLDQHPAEGTPERDQIEVLKILIKNYETTNFPEEIPDPIEAILFRLEQSGKTQKNLEPYIGNRSKVHEVLTRKRPLTLSMIRALQQGLGIPAKALLGESKVAPPTDEEFNMDNYPVKEIFSKKWLEDISTNAGNDLKAAFDIFISPLKEKPGMVPLFKKTHLRSANRSLDKYALKAWTARIIHKAMKNEFSYEFDPEKLDSEFFKDLAQLSSKEKGPLLALDYLKSYGISLVIEPHLEHTYLDGASIVYQKEHPIIALSIRHDRIDNFWFTLFHEIGHLKLHLLNNDNLLFFDDLDIDPTDDKEKEADEFARETLVPETEWAKSPASKSRMPEAVKHLANKLNISPAIVAGKIQHKYKDFRVLKQLVGLKEVRVLFNDIDWKS